MKEAKERGGMRPWKQVERGDALLCPVCIKFGMKGSQRMAG